MTYPDCFSMAEGENKQTDRKDSAFVAAPALCPSAVIVLQGPEAGSHGRSLCLMRSAQCALGSSDSPCVHASHLTAAGKHAIPNLVKNLPGGQQSSSQNFSEDTVVSILNTINEVIAENLEAAKKLRETQGIEKLVLINKSG